MRLVNQRAARRPAPSDAHEIHDQEVLRAKRELAAYFNGRRTEREARAALKIIKSFVRDRERTDPGKRRPLPGGRSTGSAKTARPPKTAPDTPEGT